MTAVEPSFDPSTFSKNRQRLLEQDVARRFFAAVVRHADARGLLSDEHFTVDGTSQAARIRQLTATPDVVVGSVSAVTEAGTLVAASASGSQLPAYAGGAGQVIWIVGAQKVVANLAEALQRVESYALPLEDVGARAAYGRSSAVNKLLIVNAELVPGRTVVLLLREPIGF